MSKNGNSRNGDGSDNGARKAYRYPYRKPTPPQTPGRPKGSWGRHSYTLVRESVISDCKKLVEQRAFRLTKAVLVEEARLAFSDIRMLFDGEGELIPPHKLPPDVAAAVRSFKRHERTIPQKGEEPITIVTYDYQFWDKPTALERLSKHLGLYKADNEQKPAQQVNTQVNINLSDFTEEELEMVVKLGGKLDDGVLALPEPAFGGSNVIDVEEVESEDEAYATALSIAKAE